MNSAILPGRHTADHVGPLVVLIIGMRINCYWRVHRWLPPLIAMQRMIRELKNDPESGFLGAFAMKGDARTLMYTQYWRDFGHLEAYARAPGKLHWDNWTRFAREMALEATVGFFHETYAVADGAQETIYINMPPFGLGAVAPLVPATGSRNSARERMRGHCDGSGLAGMEEPADPPQPPNRRVPAAIATALE